MNVTSLLDAASQSTGLTDFGSDTFREGLGVLVESLTTEADLNEMGLQSAAGQLVSFLSNRLQIEDWYRRHPEIDEQQIVEPLFVLGLPRTGSTALGRLLSEDPGVRFLRMWETGTPCPPPESATEHTDPRIAESQSRIDMMDQFMPELKTMVPAPEACGPTECLSALAFEFQSGYFETLGKAPSYSAWLIDSDMEPAYLYHRRLLKLLQWRCPPNRWRLRTPAHMYGIDALDRAYPDARFVMTHRDVASVIPSVASLMMTVSARGTDHPDPDYFGALCASTWETALHRTIAFRDRSDQARFHDISFADMQVDPIEAIRGMYGWLGEELTPQAESQMSAWRAENARGKHGEHRYEPEDFGLTADGLHKQFHFYNERFDVPLDRKKR